VIAADCFDTTTIPMSMIETVATAAKETLGSLGWRLVNINQTGRGSTVFTNDDDLRLIFEIGMWWPSDAHHLDDQPGIILFIQDKNSPKVQVPYLGEEKKPDLFWSSSESDVREQTLMIVRDFERSFLAACPDRRTLYNNVLDCWLEKHGIVDEALFNVIKDALAFDQATAAAWAERKLSILRKTILGGGRVLAFDPATKQLRQILSPGEFDTYISHLYST
jgi:hypothetical protein